MAKRKVLIVEDEEKITASLKVMLTRKGCEVLIAEKGEEAWEIFQKERPQACSLDIRLPFSQFDGLELLRRIREIDKEVYCVMLSCLEADVTRGKSKELGADAYFEKPLDSEDIFSLLNELVAGKRNKQE